MVGRGYRAEVLLAAGLARGSGLGLLTAGPGESPSGLALSSPNASDAESVKPEGEA